MAQGFLEVRHKTEVAEVLEVVVMPERLVAALGARVILQ
jgi:hypothetical protein